MPLRNKINQAENEVDLANGKIRGSYQTNTTFVKKATKTPDINEFKSWFLDPNSPTFRA